MTQTLLVNKNDFGDVTCVTAPLGDLEEGFIRCEVGPWALTANNVTYMVTGDRIGYWHYFDPSAYGIEVDNHGRMPVWGYAKVIESQCEEVEVGKVIYGFLPITQSFDMKPERLSPMGFQDGNTHRKPLHSLYNRYSFVEADPSFGIHPDLQPILRPLFTTSFLIDDFLAEKDFFGAEQVLILSASSKTALGTAFCLKERGSVRVAALTSKGNKTFTEETGFYDTVFTYDAIETLDTNLKTTLVDMSGNAKVLAELAHHFGDNITYVCKVGLSHWGAGQGPKVDIKAPVEFFFAPDQAKTRVAEWGGAGFAERLGARWIPFLNSAKDWLHIEKSEGLPAILSAYKDVLNGEAAPDKGYLFTL